MHSDTWAGKTNGVTNPQTTTGANFERHSAASGSRSPTLLEFSTKTLNFENPPWKIATETVGNCGGHPMRIKKQQVLHTTGGAKMRVPTRFSPIEKSANFGMRQTIGTM